MKGFHRENLLFSLCGLNCGLCPMHLDNHCPGCGGGEGNQSCAIARCSLSHEGVEYCSQCPEFPCEKYEGIDEWDSFITHKNQMRDLARAEAIGMVAYRAEQSRKIEILQHLLREYNDGRRKTFFCTAVNLLDLHDVEPIMEQLAGQEHDGLTIKEKAIRAASLFQAAASRENVELKLRKKPGKKK